MPESDMLKAAEAEVKKLEAELAESPLGQKLALARQVVALYRGASVVAAEAPAIFRLAGADYLKQLISIGPHTKGAKIEAAAIKHLLEKRGRATSGELLEVMNKAGVEIGGKEPNKALSAYLSGFESLNNVRELGGYGLVEWGNSKGPDIRTGVFE